MNFRKHCIIKKIAVIELLPNSVFVILQRISYFIVLLLLFNGCLSLKLVLQLPENKRFGANQKNQESTGRLKLEYQLNTTLQNISNYPTPHDDIAPMPLPLWKWDFQGIAQQSSNIELISYAFQKPLKNREAKTSEQQVIIQVELSFANEADLRLLLGPEIQWHQQGFRWKLSVKKTDFPDQSYPELNGDLNQQENELLKEIFAGETLQIIVSYNGSDRRQKNRKIKENNLFMSDFLTGKQNINIDIGR